MRTVVIAVCLLVGLVGTWFVGDWAGMHRERYQRYLDERDLLAPVLAGDPAFANLLIVESTGPGGGILLWGTVKVGAAFDRLKAELVRLFGEPRAKVLLSGISTQLESPVP